MVPPIKKSNEALHVNANIKEVGAKFWPDFQIT